LGAEFQPEPRRVPGSGHLAGNVQTRAVVQFNYFYGANLLRISTGHLGAIGRRSAQRRQRSLDGGFNIAAISPGVLSQHELTEPINRPASLGIDARMSRGYPSIRRADIDASRKSDTRGCS
jgi:hypothetical protein